MEAGDGQRTELVVNDSRVQELLRRAVERSDAEAMREALEMLFAYVGPQSLSPEAEYRVRAEDYLMEMPQSAERIRGREAMRAMQGRFPRPDDPIAARDRLEGWVVEGVNDFDGEVWHVVLVCELTDDGRIRRDTRCYVQPTNPPSYRSNGWNAWRRELISRRPQQSVKYAANVRRRRRSRSGRLERHRLDAVRRHPDSTPDRVISAQASRDPSQFRTHGEAGERGAAANRRRAAALAASRKTSILRGRGACRKRTVLRVIARRLGE